MTKIFLRKHNELQQERALRLKAIEDRTVALEQSESYSHNIVEQSRVINKQQLVIDNLERENATLAGQAKDLYEKYKVLRREKDSLEKENTSFRQNAENVELQQLDIMPSDLVSLGAVANILPLALKFIKYNKIFCDFNPLTTLETESGQVSLKILAHKFDGNLRTICDS